MASRPAAGLPRTFSSIMKAFKLLLVFLTTIVSCRQESAFVAPPDWEAGPQVAVPEFELLIELTDSTAKKLKESGETIKASIYFDGDGHALPRVKTAPHRDVFLGHHEVEVNQQGVVHIKDAHISEEAYGRLTDKNYHFFVNVYSGRRVFKNNILDGGYADGRLEDLESAKPIRVSCSLLTKP